jgi:hypothetical protein
MSKLRIKTLSSLLLIAAIVSVGSVAHAQDSLPESEDAVGEPDAGGNAGTGGTSAGDAGSSGTGGATAARTTSVGVGGSAAKGGGTRVLPGPDLDGPACSIARAPNRSTISTTECLLLMAASLAAIRKRGR